VTEGAVPSDRIASILSGVCKRGDLTMCRVTVLSMLGRHVLSSAVLSHERRIDLVSMRLYGADNGR
jgi:hypothetical protein